MKEAGWPAIHMSWIETVRVGSFCAVVFLTYYLSVRWCLERICGRKPRGRFDRAFQSGWAGAGLLSAAVFGAACMGYGFWVEPKRLTVTQYTIETSKIPEGQSVRIVHLSDLHVRERGPRERNLPELVRSLNPDLILHTGDFFARGVGLEPIVGDILKAWDVPQYACAGNLDHLGDFHDVMGRTGVNVLTADRAQLTIRGVRLSIPGFPPMGEAHMRERLVDLPRDTFNVVLYHLPQGFPETWGTPADLMLAGHTHGGQVRLPFYGALITFDRFGKRWEGGCYNERNVQLIVSRGIGCEPGMPEVRFLCPPEVVVVDVVGTGGIEGEEVQ
ncbi:MAG: metallophosphoesterase [Acidobacteria bacterium]|nr:metallophosphoesterase [Acidobacteriota bacterium]